jgi:hypothetical protein
MTYYNAEGSTGPSAASRLPREHVTVDKPADMSSSSLPKPLKPCQDVTNGKHGCSKTEWISFSSSHYREISSNKSSGSDWSLLVRSQTTIPSCRSHVKLTILLLATSCGVTLVLMMHPSLPHAP